MATLTTDDLPGVGCRHVVRTAVVDAVEAYFTSQPTVAERTITHLAAIKQRLATAAGVTAAQVSNKMVARAVQAFIDERFGGTD